MKHNGKCKGWHTGDIKWQYLCVDEDRSDDSGDDDMVNISDLINLGQVIALRTPDS